jgi:uncharacterized protein YbjT (DUF2867 family)
MYAIIGATGKTGHVVAEELLARGEKVRAIAHNADHLKTLKEKGADTFVGSAVDANAMTKAFTGAEAVYVLIPPNFTAPGGMRAYQNEVANVLATAVERAGVKYAVVLSSLGAEHSENTGPVKGLHDLEQRFSKLSGVNVLFLRPAFFMENSLGSIPMIEKTGVLAATWKGDLPLPMIASHDIGVYAAKRLLARDFTGKSHQDLLGPRNITWKEITHILGEALGKPDITYQQISYEDAINGMVSMGGVPRQAAESFVELSKAANDGLVKASEPRSAKNSTPTTYEEFAEQVVAVHQK